MKNQRGAGARSACALRTVPSRPVFPDCAEQTSTRPRTARGDEIAEVLQAYMEVRRGLGGARQDEWLAAAGGDSLFVYGLFASRSMARRPSSPSGVARSNGGAC